MKIIMNNKEIAEGGVAILAGNDFDEIPEGELGSSKDHPYLSPPPEFEDDGLPYGAWCLCHKCGTIGRSTFRFDFYRDNEWLECETCCMGYI